jgi:predicted MFS family arabinose efflux permease
MQISRLSLLRSQMLLLIGTRTVMNTGFRMIYPFLPVIARGLGVPIEQVVLVVSLRSALGASGPLLGSLGDVLGRRNSMLLGLVIFIIGAALIGLWPTYAIFALGLLLIGASKLIFDPAEQAYLGDRVHYDQRGRAIALTELGWSFAFLLGVPAAGWLMAARGWSAPFPWLALLALIALIALRRLVPADPGSGDGRPSLVAGIRIVLAHPSALFALASVMLMVMSNETISIVYGVWMESSFGLQLVALGSASAVIGLAELGGEGLVAGLADRMGKRRAVLLGLLANSLSSLALPILGASLPGAMLALFFFYISFEFTIVSSLPMMTEQVPRARATLMAANVTAISVGRTLGSQLGARLFPISILANAGAAVTMNVLAIILLLAFVIERRSPPAAEGT